MNKRFERIRPGIILDNTTGIEHTCIISPELLRIINEICDENEKLVNINIHLCASIEEDLKCKQY